MPKEVLASTTGAMLPAWLELEQLGPFDAFAQAMGTTMLAIALVQCLCSFYTDARSLRVFALLYLLTGIGWLVAHPRAHGDATDVPMLPAMVAVLLLALQLMPGSALPVYGIMAAGFAYCAWLALRASLLEDNVGHRYIALAYATYPLLFALYVALPSWLAHFEMGYYAAVPAMIVGMMIVAVSLIRSRQRTEDELRRRVAAEESLRLLNVTLEDRVASRTGDLHDLVSGLESFNRSVSHDLRGPLAGMGGLAKLGAQALDSHDHDKVRAFLALIETQALQMVGMVQDLLELSKAADAPWQP